MSRSPLCFGFETILFESAAYSFSFIDVLAPLLFPVGGNRRNCTWTMIDIEGLRGTYRCGLEGNET